PRYRLVTEVTRQGSSIEPHRPSLVLYEGLFPSARRVKRTQGAALPDQDADRRILHRAIEGHLEAGRSPVVVVEDVDRPGSDGHDISGSERRARGGEDVFEC